MQTAVIFAQKLEEGVCKFLFLFVVVVTFVQNFQGGWPFL
jgi:hypothetical protein